MMERAEPQLSSSLGRITISTGAIGQIVSQTASRCYGVVEIGGGARAKVGRLLPRSRGVHGISVSGDGDSGSLDLHVVVEHGLNLAEVAATIRSQVQYEVERLTGLRVAAGDVHILGVRQSAGQRPKRRFFSYAAPSPRSSEAGLASTTSTSI